MWCARGRLRTAAFQNLDKASGMASNTKLFGYWISSVDEEGAREAIKMAGLPVLVMGGNAALTALISLSQQTPDLTLASWCAIEPPPLNWSTTMFRKRRTRNGKQATEARRDRYKVTPN